MAKNRNILDAVHLVDDNKFNQYGGVCSSWDFITDGQTPSSTSVKPGFFTVSSFKKGECFLRRDCNRFEGGKITFELYFQNISGDGLFFGFGTREASFLKLYTKGEELFCGDKAICALSYDFHYMRLICDLENGTYTLILDAKTVGSYGLENPDVPFDCIMLGYGLDDMGEASFGFCKAYVNYLVNDNCLNYYVGALSDEYETKAPFGSSVMCDVRVKGKEEYTYISRNRKGSATVTKRSFDKSSGVVVFEARYLLTEPKGKITLELCSGNRSAVSVYDEGELLCLYDGTALRNHHINVWQTLRVYADTASQTCVIYLNGKKTQTVDFKCKAKTLDNFKITYKAYEKSSCMFSDFRVWIQPEEPEDYVPQPIVPKKKGDYTVGMNICSLWREGTHFGWDKISAFDDIKPVLGFYDEGLPETADWEIKFMAEHGIDYELYCWYSSESHDPIKTTDLRYAWLEGHFYAKYRSYEKIALLWEAANCQHPKSLQDFKDNLVPYWLDYFFSDPDYMRIDNKAVMSCFGVGCVEADLGGEACVREGLQYLRDEVKKLGYDDLIVMGCHAEPHDLDRLGFDAFHAYHWGASGYLLETNINSNNDRIAVNKTHIVPTTSVGFKNVGWGGDRRPNLSVEDFYKSIVYCRDEILPKYEKNSWKSKMLHISTWNEYGEGTYIMPSGLCGFGYLDSLRKAVCVDEPHKDVVPTENQKKRICYLYRQDRAKLIRTKYDVRPTPEKEEVAAKFTFKSESDIKKWKFTGIDNLEIKDGCLCGRATQNLPEMELKKCNLDASEIAFAKITLTNCHAYNKAPTVCYIVPSTKPEKNDYDYRNRGFAVWAKNPEVAEYYVDLDTKAFWNNIIHGLKLVPTYSGTFKLESLTFYKSTPHITVYDKDGKQLVFGDYPKVIGNEVFVSLEPVSGIIGATGMRYEWFKNEGRLEFYERCGKTGGVQLVVGRAYAVKNGEIITLKKPPYLKDGVPEIALSDFQLLFDVSSERIGNKIYLK